MDRTEPIRQAMVEEINCVPSERELLEISVGNGRQIGVVWDVEEIKEVWK